MSIFDFFTREAGQERRRALEGLLTQFIPPEMRPQLGLLAEANPVVSMERAGQDAQQLFAPDQTIMDRIASLGRMSSNIAGTVAPAVVAGRAGVPVVSAVQDVLTGYAPMMQPFMADESGALRLFHGSPHDFDRFSMSKIGTGEGAQAYGHGLYFAEAEDTARAYRDALRFPRMDSIATPRDAVVDDLNYHRGNVDGVRESYQSMIASGNPDAVRMGSEKLALLDSVVADNPGRMYEVQINANPEDFLDWDKSLSEQPAKVRDAFFARYTAERPWLTPETVPNMQGSEMYSALGFRDPSKQSQELLEAGIPGIRYLDAGSRGTGDGSRNYVVFDENLIEIVRKYGIAGAAAMLGMSQADVAQAMQQQPQPQGLLAGPQ